MFSSSRRILQHSPTAAPSERSFLRHLVPLRVLGSGPASSQLRHAFLQQPRLIPVFLGALEQVPLPALPRMIMAEGFQQLLDGRAPQRELRDLFEDADVECRKVLLGMDFDASGVQSIHSTSREERELFESVKTDPLRRLLMYELRGAAGYYARMMAVSSEPEVSASILLRTLIASDVRLDALIGKVVLAFDAHPRDTATGAPMGEPVPAFVSDLMRELLLLERDAFGKYRFDARGDNRMLTHCIKLDNMVKTPDSFSTLLDATMRESGNFVLDSEEVFGRRWMKHRLYCGEEDPRILADLPELETVVTPDDVNPTTRHRLHVRYADPICHRHKETTREVRGSLAHEEVFELAIEDTSRSYWERFFLDR